MSDPCFLNYELQPQYNGGQTIKLAPSILAADFSRLGEQVVEAERRGAARIQMDVMDGYFVLHISLGALVVEALRMGNECCWERT